MFFHLARERFVDGIRRPWISWWRSRSAVSPIYIPGPLENDLESF
jgi:hypothetical protein